ncbi:hypothetical protein [Bradyrhizobium retamae]|nr:hypothetical protein [Bradyrhizobium retamae]
MAYLPLVSTFRFSSSFIVVVAGGLSLGTEVCPGDAVAGRVAVVLGGSL